MTRHPFGWGLIAAAFVLAWGMPVVAGVPGGGGVGGAPTLGEATMVNRDPVQNSLVLGSVFKRESDGFRMTPPAGSRVIDRTGIDLMSFVLDRRSWGGSVQRIVLDKVMSLEDYVKTTKNEMLSGGVFKGVQVQEEKYLRKDNYPAARLSFSMEAELGPAVPAAMVERMGLKAGANERVSVFRQQFISRTRDNQFQVLIMYTPLKDRAEATRVFDLMLTEYEIFDPATMKKRRVEAIQAGKKWLEQHTAEEFAGKLVREPAYYRILVGAKDVGYIRFDEGTQEPDPRGGANLLDVERDRRKGVLLRVNFRSFPEDGSVIYGQNEAFWGFSKTPSGDLMPGYSSWSNLSKTKTKIPLPLNQVRPGAPTVREVTPWMQETGVLTQVGKPYQIMVTLSGDAGQRLPNGINQLIPVEEASPLPKILEYSWPRLVDLTRPSEMTFVVFDPSKKYDAKTKGMALRTLIVTGRRESVTIDGKPTVCFKCIDELDPDSTTLWTDKDGRIQMMQTSDQSVMIPTTEQAMLTRWAQRLGDQ